MDSIGNFLYTTSYKYFKVWDVNTMKMVSDITAHMGAIKCVKTIPTASDGNFVFATAGDKGDKTINIWDILTLTKMTELKGHGGEIRSLEFS